MQFVMIDEVKELKMTTKRRVMLPAEVCEALDPAPADEVLLVSQECRGEPVWILGSSKKPDRSWMGALGRYAKEREHSLAHRESRGDKKRTAPRRTGSPS